MGEWQIFSGVYVPANLMVLNLGSNFRRKSREVRANSLLLSWGSSEPLARVELGVFLYLRSNFANNKKWTPYWFWSALSPLIYSRINIESLKWFALEDPLVDIKAETMRETSWISRKISIPAGDSLRRHKKLFMANFNSNPCLDCNEIQSRSALMTFPWNIEVSVGIVLTHSQLRPIWYFRIRHNVHACKQRLGWFFLLFA